MTKRLAFGGRLAADDGAAGHAKGGGMAILEHVVGTVAERLPIVAGGGNHPLGEDGAVECSGAQLVEDTEVVVAATVAAGGVDHQEAVLADLNGIRMGRPHVVGAGFARKWAVGDQSSERLYPLDHGCSLPVWVYWASPPGPLSTMCRGGVSWRG